MFLSDMCAILVQELCEEFDRGRGKCVVASFTAKELLTALAAVALVKNFRRENHSL